MNDNFYKQVTAQFEMILKESEEKDKRTAELIIANKELAFQNEEKANRVAELIIANNKLIIANKESSIANKARGEFLVNVSHELKTPLNVICATAQLYSMYCNSGSLDEKKDSIIRYMDSIT